MKNKKKAIEEKLAKQLLNINNNEPAQIIDEEPEHDDDEEEEEEKVSVPLTITIFV